MTTESSLISSAASPAVIGILWAILLLFIAGLSAWPYLKATIVQIVKRKALKFLDSLGIVVGRDIVVHDDCVFLEWAINGSLGIGETYMTGAWETKAISLEEFWTRFIRLPPGVKRRVGKPWSWRIVGLYNRLFNLQSSKRAGIVAERHYDLGNDFFKLWLDKNMQYTCAYWKGVDVGEGSDDGLEEAQLNKMRLIAEKVKLEPGMRVVDMGCGWGTLACFLAEHYGVHVTGINISKEQIKYARDLAKSKGLSDKTNFILDDYRKLRGEYDRVVAVGLLEHVGYKNLGGFFDLVSQVLKPGGLALVHTITNGKTVITYTDQWLCKYIFPNGFLPSPKLLMEHAESKLVVEDVQNIGVDYWRTLRAWLKRFRECVQSGVISGDKRDETFIRMWEHYLEYSAAGFRTRYIHLYQVVYSKKAPERYDAPR